MIESNHFYNRSKPKYLTLGYTFSFLVFVGGIFLLSYHEAIPTYRITQYISTVGSYSSELIRCAKPKTALGIKEFLQRSELIRSRFLEKRTHLLIRNQSLSQVNSWDSRRTVFFWHFFPPTLTCPHLIERIGTPSNGGKWVCGFELFEKGPMNGYRNKDECIVYSFGASAGSSFEEEFLRRTNCSIFVFDFSVDKIEMNLHTKIDPSRLKFKKKGLAGIEGESDMYFTLGEFMKDNNHDWIDFLKIDIEGAEYEALEYILKQFGTFPFGHLNVKVHLKGKQDGIFSDANEVFQKFFRWWETLENGGLRAFIWENNYQPVLKFKNKPVIMEYGFVNIQALKKNRLLQF